jgi:hypothetical protein
MDFQIIIQLDLPLMSDFITNCHQFAHELTHVYCDPRLLIGLLNRFVKWHALFFLE